MNKRQPSTRATFLFRLFFFGLLWAVQLPAQTGFAQEQTAGAAPADLSLRDFRPRSTLIVPETKLAHAAFPVIDLHTHFRLRMREATPEDLGKYVREVLDPNQVAICISLDAKLGEEDEHLNYLAGPLADRFGVFVHLDFQGSGQAARPETWAVNQPSFAREVAAKLQRAKASGCLGVKFFKQFGLEHPDSQGRPLRINDRRFDPIWKACGELGLPVLMHVADPAAFFLPTDATNERWEELARHPEWSFADSKFPRRERLAEDFLEVVARHRGTTFVAAHCLNYANDLGTLGKWLEAHSNLYVDIASRINELGRQPYTARAFFDRFDQRILFATDGPWPAERLGYYWRFLETFDENFPYSEKQPPPQGLWSIDGIGLRQESLRRIYFENAIRLMPALKEKYERSSRKLHEQATKPPEKGA
ncbi:MAG: amidohydrolase family protein [Planctomycetota bacterium]